MRRLITLAVLLIFICCSSPMARAENSVLAAGAGYKKMVNALNKAYQQKTGTSLDLVYGNMARVTTQARQSGRVDIVLGDESFLTKSGLSLATIQLLGQGRLVLAFAKGSKFSKLDDLDNPEAGRIALPDTKKAIYGKAAREYLTNTKRLPGIKPRLVEVATVPQVFSYLATNEVDMGFLNLTHTLNVADKIGGYVEIDTKDYGPIRIIAAILDGCPNPQKAKDFLAFLKTPEAESIIKANGL